MLTISKPLSASQAQTYHAKEFTSNEQNYWSQKGEIRGEWQGELAGQVRTRRCGFRGGFCAAQPGAASRNGRTTGPATRFV